jgi:hypothetical protein
MERLETLGMTEFGVPVHDGHDPSHELVAFLEAEGVVGAVNVLAGDSSAEVYGVLFADESGVPAQWFPDEAAVGFGRGELEGFRMRLRERFGRAAWVGEPDAPADDETGPPSHGWGIRSFAWYTESQQFGAPELVAHALGGPVTWVPLGRGVLYVPHDPQALVISGYWRRGRSVLMWASRSRRAFAAGGRFRSDLRWWDQHFVVVDPSDGWQVDHDGLTMRQIVESQFELDPSFRIMARAARVREHRAQEFRIELRKPSSSPDTFARMADYCGIPAEVALVAEGSLDPLELPGAEIAGPATRAESIWLESRIPLPGPFRVFQWWARVTAGRPPWYRVMTVAVVLAAVGVTALVVVTGRSAEYALLPLGAAAVWILDYARPRPRSIDRAAGSDGAAWDRTEPLSRQ